MKYCAHCGTLLTGIEGLDASEPLPAGTLIGSYRILDLLGEGGMGRIYVAEHVKLGRRVAIKMLRAELVSNSVAVARFFAEARAVNRISHENIVEITDFLEQPGGDNCIVMELLKGEDLSQRLLRKQTMPLSRVLDIAAQTASALAAVHQAGIIHRDLKPDNIFLIERGGSSDVVKLLDFGVAKLSDP
ncbi:MAG: serine/threonine protein kinase, partial [Myxococcales bacterium]|nr:serine/threonine protein kinase [Myxococcales bacterium]